MGSGCRIGGSAFGSSYRQIRLAELQSVADLAAIVYDSGVQLGAARFLGQTVQLSEYDQKRILGGTGRLEKRYRGSRQWSVTCSADGGSSEHDESVVEFHDASIPSARVVRTKP